VIILSMAIGDIYSIYIYKSIPNVCERITKKSFFFTFYLRSKYRINEFLDEFLTILTKNKNSPLCRPEPN
jgi:hypothetical protein